VFFTISVDNNVNKLTSIKIDAAGIEEFHFLEINVGINAAEAPNNADE
jgi:hypothetical protein